MVKSSLCQSLEDRVVCGRVILLLPMVHSTAALWRETPHLKNGQDPKLGTQSTQMSFNGSTCMVKYKSVEAWQAFIKCSPSMGQVRYVAKSIPQKKQASPLGESLSALSLAPAPAPRRATTKEAQRLKTLGESYQPYLRRFKNIHR